MKTISIEQEKVQKGSQDKIEFLTKLVAQLSERIDNLQSRRKKAVPKATGKKTGDLIDVATITHAVPTIKGTGYNVF